MKLATIILAAGKGKRMGDSSKSKVMFELTGKPMIAYVIELALKVGSEKIVVIIGYERESLKEFIESYFADNMDRIVFAVQEEQLGSGHAANQAHGALQDFDGNILILSGDVPLLHHETIERLEHEHRMHKWTGSLISAEFENPFGYGRILRDGDHHFTSIREERDASESEKLVNEVNSGIYLVDSHYLFEALGTVRTDNAQGEYYLTDIFGYFSQHSLPIGATKARSNTEVLGVNTQDQLRDLEAILARN